MTTTTTTALTALTEIAAAIPAGIADRITVGDTGEPRGTGPIEQSAEFRARALIWLASVEIQRDDRAYEDAEIQRVRRRPWSADVSRSTTLVVGEGERRFALDPHGAALVDAAGPSGSSAAMVLSYTATHGSWS